MTQPAVSVVMSVRNEEVYLRAAIESILGQSLADFELIVVDDGSTDGTGAIIEEFAGKDARLRPLAGQARGLAAALNLGLRHARAELIARMDGDDIALPDRLERQVAWMAAHPDVIALGTAVELIDANGRAIRRRRPPTEPEAIARTLPRRNVICHPSAIVRAQAYGAVGGYREEFLTAEDYDLWLRLLGVGRIANLSVPLLQYRKHGGRVSDAGNLARTTVYSVAAAADHFGRLAGIPPREEPIDIAQPDAIAAQLERLLKSDLSDRNKRVMIRHVLRFLRHARGIPADRAASLRAASKSYMSVADRLKALLYGV